MKRGHSSLLLCNGHFNKMLRFLTDCNSSSSALLSKREYAVDREGPGVKDAHFHSFNGGSNRKAIHMLLLGHYIGF